jgi:hypothetical protein
MLENKKLLLVAFFLVIFNVKFIKERHYKTNLRLPYNHSNDYQKQYQWECRLMIECPTASLGCH